MMSSIYVLTYSAFPSTEQKPLSPQTPGQLHNSSHSTLFLLCHTTLQALHNAISLFTARSLILKALRKKHFYKETIRIDRLLPREQLDSTKVMLNDWIGWDSESCKRDLLSSEINNQNVGPYDKSGNISCLL
jgi:hypothetical protein